MQIMVLGHQIFPRNTKYFMECYQGATNQPFGFLLIPFKRSHTVYHQLNNIQTKLEIEYSEKYYVIHQTQMNKLRAENVRETIQQVLENNLDDAIRNILQRSDLDPHGKAKLYSNVLLRF